MPFSTSLYPLLALCFFPAAVLFFAIVRFGKVPPIAALLAFVLGGAALAPIGIIQLAIPFPEITNWHLSLLHTLIVIGLTEESVKAAALFLLPAKKLSLSAFFLLSLFLGLSLGCFESALFFLKQLQKASALGAHVAYRSVFLRIFTSDIVHAFAASLSGTAVFSAKQKRFFPVPFLLAVLLHGLYDFFALYSRLKLFSIICILLLLLEARTACVNAKARPAKNQPRHTRKKKVDIPEKK